jgi:hypothetical protein
VLDAQATNSGASPTPTSTSTPAVTPAPAPSSATEAAVQKGDFSAFREARRAEREGKPLPTPKADSSTAEASASDPSHDAGAHAGSQQQPAAKAGGKNADTRVQELLAERARLRRELEEARRGSSAPPAKSGQQPGSQPAAGAHATDPRPDPTDVAKYPDGQYDPKFIEDLGRWAAREERREADRLAQERAAETARTERSRQRNQQFTSRMNEAKTADPSFLQKLSPDVLSLRPFDALEPGEQPTARHAIAEEILGSEVGPQLLLHFSENPADLDRLSKLGPRDLLREFARIEDRVLAARTAASTAPPPKSTAPPPPARLDGKQTTPADPLKSAVAKGDFGAFRRAKLERLAATAR